MIRSFEDLWKANAEWRQGILVKETKLSKTAELYLGFTPEEWFNYALPRIEKPTELDLEGIKKALFPAHPSVSIYLWEKHVKAGFPEFLTQKGFKLLTKDTWMIFNHAFSVLTTKFVAKH
jgi:hypothetical protein